MTTSSQMGTSRVSGLREPVRDGASREAEFEAGRAQLELRITSRALDLMARIGASEEEPSHLRPLYEIACEIADAFGDFCALRLLTRDGAWLEVAAIFPEIPGLGDTRERGRRDSGFRQSSASEGLAANVLNDRRSACIRRDAFLPEHDGDLELAERFGFDTMLLVPLVGGGRSLGTLLVARSVDEPFVDDEERLIRELAERAVVPLVLAEQRRAEEHHTRERVALLAQASGLLAQSFDYERTLENVANVLVPHLADYVLLEIREGEELRRLGRALSGERLEQLTGGPSSRAEPARSGARLDGRIDDAYLERIARSDEELALLRNLDPQSAIHVPLSYQKDELGSLTLFFGPSQRRHSEADLPLSEEVSRRAAAAIMNARLLKEAREAIGVRDDFLSMAGHELRTPLTALQLQILSITKMIGQADGAEKIASRAEKASKNVLRLSNLVNELLDVSRITAGRLKLERAAADLGTAVREVVTRHREELEKNGCNVQLKLATDVVGCWDSLRVEQVITSLLTNAIKYGKGQPIEIEVEKQAGFARLTVRDHGIGIPAEDQQRIFHRFERAVSSRHFGGLGFGLWIARQLVDAHGGNIRVNSQAGQGATFEVDLPLESSEEVGA